ncbi:hypothetical protein L1857_04780 [Amycolatopsis thermalba]|uniref:Uncharacterized protein n=1 Tax=Amycolatopsis thermalba TaxID=944492 RepID=A0ABY4NPU8_9PSEU|nr:MULTISPECIES: hypothetical protein [Amycolatopsis]UQS22183.1 hypothetical protein L1857_04780 [Amycolatopsis thermalba]
MAVRSPGGVAWWVLLAPGGRWGGLALAVVRAAGGVAWWVLLAPGGRWGGLALAVVRGRLFELVS